MTDEPLSPDAELASAYLDGDLTEIERARAEASPSVMTTIDEYRRLRARLTSVEPASDQWRASALNAAMSAFDESSGHAIDVSAAPRAAVIDFSKRRKQQRWLVGSAAAAVLLVVGFAVANRGGSDSKSISAAATTELSRTSKSAEAAPSAAIPRPTIGSIDGAGSVLLAIDTPEQLAALVTESFASSAPQGDSTAAGNIPPAVTAASAQTTADTTAGTAAAVATTVAVADADTTAAAAGPIVAASPTAPCVTPDVVFLNNISYQGTTAVAVRVLATGAVRALDATDCHLIIEVPAP